MITTRWRALGTDTGDASWLVVGDVHGQWDAYKRLLAAFAQTRTTGRRTLVTLGDIIDRGPNSLHCIKATLDDEAAERSQADVHIRLFGNHEILMLETLRAMETPYFSRRFALWNRSGAQTVLDETAVHDNPALACAAIVSTLGMKRLATFQDWKAGHSAQGVRFVHAGYNPSVGWDKTMAMPGSALWSLPDNGSPVRNEDHWAAVRQPFLFHKPTGGDVVFHGHSTPRLLARKPMTCPGDITAALSRLSMNRRICLDGGSGQGVGVAGAVIYRNMVKLIFSPV